MSDQHSDEQTEHSHHVDTFEVTVEHEEGAWQVVRAADGERSVLQRHSDRAAAELQAEMVRSAADRFTGAARHEQVPAAYPR